MHRTLGVPTNPDPPNASPERYRDALGRPAGTVYYDTLGHRREVTAPQFTADDGTVTYGHEAEQANDEHYAKIEHMRANRTLEQREAVARYYDHLNAELDRLTASKRERGWKPGEVFDFSAEWHEASRSAANTVVAGLRGRRAGSGQRPRGAGRPRVRAAQRSSAESGDSGSDSDGSDGPEPPEGRLCEAPWCSHPVYDGGTYCKTDHCKRARAAERQRKRRAQLAADWVLVERRQRDEDTHAAGYYVFAHAATGLPDRQGRDGHNLSFLWRFGLMPGRDPGEHEAIPLRLLCQCNGHHIDGGAVGCVKCGKHRGRVYGYGPLGVVA
jgi:hypothetical protein